MDDKEKTLYAGGKEACDHLDALCSRIRELAYSARRLVNRIGVCPLEVRVDAGSILAATIKELESLYSITKDAWNLDRHELLWGCPSTLMTPPTRTSSMSAMFTRSETAILGVLLRFRLSIACRVMLY